MRSGAINLKFSSAFDQVDKGCGLGLASYPVVAFHHIHPPAGIAGIVDIAYAVPV
jgi:hypothetical protein